MTTPTRSVRWWPGRGDATAASRIVAMSALVLRRVIADGAGLGDAAAMTLPPPYDTDAQDALLAGQVLTRERGVALFEPEALVAAMVADRDGAGAALIDALGIDPAAVRNAAEQALAGFPRADRASDVAVASPPLRAALAEAEAEGGSRGVVGVADLLVGVLVAGGTPVARALAHLGINPVAVRGARTRSGIGTEPPARATSAAPPAAPVPAPPIGADPSVRDTAAAPPEDEAAALLDAALAVTRLAVDAIAEDLRAGGFGPPSGRVRTAIDWATAAPSLLAQLDRLRRDGAS